MTATTWAQLNVGDRFTERGTTYEVQSVGSVGDEVRIAAAVVQSYWLRRPAGGPVEVVQRRSSLRLLRLQASGYMDKNRPQTRRSGLPDPVESGAQNGPRAARTAEGQEHQEKDLMNGSESTAERCCTHVDPRMDGGVA